MVDCDGKDRSKAKRCGHARMRLTYPASNPACYVSGEGGGHSVLQCNTESTGTSRSAPLRSKVLYVPSRPALITENTDINPDLLRSKEDVSITQKQRPDSRFNIQSQGGDIQE